MNILMRLSISNVRSKKHEIKEIIASVFPCTKMVEKGDQVC